MQIESYATKCIPIEEPDLPPAGGAAGRPTPGGDLVGAAKTAGAGMEGLQLCGEEMIDAIVANMSRDINSQAVLERCSISQYKRQCRAMRKKILELTASIRAMSAKGRKRGLLAKIFQWAAVVLAAIAAAALAVFTGGGSVAAYGVAIGAAAAAGAVGAASGGCSIAASVAQKKQLEASADMKKAQLEKAVAQQIKDEALMRMEDLFELDARVGEQARAIMQKYDCLRQQSITWR